MFCAICGKEFHSIKANQYGPKKYCSSICYRTHRLKVAPECDSNRRNIIRQEIIDILGRECKHCGCTDKRCLQIDHIYNDGKKERNNLRDRLTYYKFILNKIKSGSNDYQLLCANCNTIKEYERRKKNN